MAFQNDFRPTRPSCAGLEISEGGVWDAGGNTRNNDGKKGIKINLLNDRVKWALLFPRFSLSLTPQPAQVFNNNN